jgi:hypothetical protein
MVCGYVMLCHVICLMRRVQPIDAGPCNSLLLPKLRLYRSSGR